MNVNTIKRPIITEKSMRVATATNAYTFEVDRGANKKQIAEAVESLYGVNVQKVTMIMYAAQVLRTGRRRMKATVGKRKKAVVTLQKGQTLDVFDINPTENK